MISNIIWIEILIIKCLIIHESCGKPLSKYTEFEITDHDLLCNGGTWFACVCHRSDNTLPYQNCDRLLGSKILLIVDMKYVFIYILEYILKFYYSVF